GVQTCALPISVAICGCASDLSVRGPSNNTCCRYFLWSRFRFAFSYNASNYRLSRACTSAHECAINLLHYDGPRFVYWPSFIRYSLPIFWFVFYVFSYFICYLFCYCALLVDACSESTKRI